MVDEPQTSTALPPIVAVTSPQLAVVRVHGRRTETWEAKDIPVVAGIEVNRLAGHDA